jgi:hypothetical protein
MELYLHSPHVFMAWCLIKWAQDNFTLQINSAVPIADDDDNHKNNIISIPIGVELVGTHAVEM